MRMFLDACVIIYWVEAAEPFYSEFIFKLTNISKEYPSHILTISRLSLLECLVKPLRNKDQKTLSVYQGFFENPELSIIEIDHQVIDIATELRSHYNIRTPDAIQAASCLSIDSPHLFLTNDKRFNIISKLNTCSL